MDRSKQALVKYAVQLASLCNQYYDDLHESTMQLLKYNISVQITSQEVSEQIEYETAARLFFDYGRENPTRIKNIDIIKKLLSEVWFMSYIAKRYDTLSAIELKTIAKQKLNLEKKYDPKLTDQKYSITYWFLKRFSTSEDIKKCGELLSQIDSHSFEALNNIYSYFEKIGKLDYASTVYPQQELESVKKEAPVQKVVVNEQKENKEPKTSNISRSNQQQELKRYQEIISSLKSDKKLIEAKMHKMQVDMEHMKQDIVRDILQQLTNPTYGYPLSELFVLSKAESTPPEIRNVIKKLFLTFGDVGVRLIKTTEIGKEFMLDETTNKKYDVHKYQEIKIGDMVCITYPGYRYENDIMIQPTVKRKEEE